MRHAGLALMPEARTCRNCKQPFVIEPEDSALYERIKVPPPTFCFICRVQRRMAFRNERMLYKRKCDAPGHSEELISVFSPDNKQRVYDHSVWWSDTWDPLAYGREVDFSRPFLEQIAELWREVPDIALMNINPVNSEYCSITEGNKNCYLVFGGDFNENTLYSTYIFHSKESMDTYWVSKSEFNYETIDCIQCSRLSFSRYCEGCYDSAFLFNCKNCHDCFGCTNLINASYQIFNVPYTKEEYARKLKEYDLSSRRNLARIKEDFAAHTIKYPRRATVAVRTVNSTGNNLENSKNCKYCFDVFEGAEDCKYVWLVYSGAKDCMDVDRVGPVVELGYDSSTIYPGNRVMFSRFTFSSHDIQYSYNSHNSSNLFGCVGVRGKQYCILNKQYTQEEYETLVPRIIEHMNAMPYIDRGSVVYKYGEFFPPEISPFAYNETLAQEIVSLNSDLARERGYSWREPDVRSYQITLPPEKVPDKLGDVTNKILEEVIGCEHKGSCNEQCSGAFKLVPAELALYRKFNVPIPHLCPSCRHYARISQRNPLQLWTRSCQCSGASSANGAYRNSREHFHKDRACPHSFETSYAPDRSEVVYCEECYNAEIV